jgi:hypothetical protein
MRRDYFHLAVDDVDWLDDGGTPRKPRVTIQYSGPAATLRSRLDGTHGDGDRLTGAETDAGFRLRTGLDDEDASGVFSITERATGDFVLECNEAAETVLELVRAARRYGEEEPDDDARYRIEVDIDDERVATFEKATFLVYDDDGNLLREQSLIPSGVEL